MWEAIKPFIARVVAGLVASLASFLQMKYGIVLDPETVAGVVSTGVGVAFFIYSIVHRLLSKKTDPLDAAVANKTTAAEVKNM